MKKALLKFCFILVALSTLDLTAAAPRQTHHSVHEGRRVNLFIVGTGVVGGALIDQIEMNGAALAKRLGVEACVVGISNSRTIMYNPKGINLKNWRVSLSESKETMEWYSFLRFLTHTSLKNVIFVDCTSNQTIADCYEYILKAGISIVTPNKKAASGSYAKFEELHEIAERSRAQFIYDANVGAGLPVLSTVRSLVRSGDEIVKVEAVLSGTLSFLFNSFQEGTPFSEIVKAAQAKGYTEPDPRDDLNGMDFARKLLILSRTAGFATEKEQIVVQRFLPDSCFSAPSVDGFYEQLKGNDEAMSEMRKKAEAEGKRLRYIGSFENGKGAIALQAVGPAHPFYSLEGSANIIAIWTKYYPTNPIVIKGPGAGADVTAARVLEGIITIGME